MNQKDSEQWKDINTHFGQDDTDFILVTVTQTSVYCYPVEMAAVQSIICWMTLIMSGTGQSFSTSKVESQAN